MLSPCNNRFSSHPTLAPAGNDEDVGHCHSTIAMEMIHDYDDARREAAPQPTFAWSKDAMPRPMDALIIIFYGR